MNSRMGYLSAVAVLFGASAAFAQFPTTGACCLPDGGCASLTAVQCAAQGGSFSSVGIPCSLACPGACCRDGVCSEVLSIQCLDGTFMGAGTSCGIDTCVDPTALTTEFTYQGRLDDAGSPANGPYDIIVTLWDDEVAGTMLGENVFDGYPVSEGILNLDLDFGPGAIDGTKRWLEIEVRPAGVGSYEILSPRTKLTATPYALQTRGIFVDESDNIGIGTMEPLGKLHVAGTAIVDNSLIVSAPLGQNALAVTGQGRISFLGVASDNPEQIRLHVENGNDASLSGGGYAVFGSHDSTNIIMDNNEIMARNNGAASGLFLNNDGGYVFVDAAGNGGLSIGTTNSSYRLNVDGSAEITNGDVFVDEGNVLLYSGNVIALDGNVEVPAGDLMVGTTVNTHSAVIKSPDENTLRLIGPTGTYGYGGKLNFGDGDYAYIQEDLDDALTIQADRTAVLGRVGIGIQDPITPFHVVGNTTGHVATIENENTGQGDGLMIKLHKELTNKENNYITFRDGRDVTTGRIEGFNLAAGDWQPPPVTFSVDLDIDLDLGSLPTLSFTAEDILGFDVPTGLSFSGGSLPSFGDSVFTFNIPTQQQMLDMMTWATTNNIDGFMTLDPVSLATQSIKVAAMQAAKDKGIVYGSKGADYAEWLPKLNPKDQFQFGQLVGVYGGKISLNTEGADSIMAISHAPVVLGNMPEEGTEDAFEKVAFMGQVLVVVRGQVKPGDYIVASGLEDGTGIAVAPEDLAIDHLDHVLGRAWSASDNNIYSLINVSVGVGRNDAALVLKQHQMRFEELFEDNIDLRSSNEELSATVDQLTSQLTELQRAVSEIRASISTD